MCGVMWRVLCDVKSVVWCVVESEVCCEGCGMYVVECGVLWIVWCVVESGETWRVW